ncbi:hypothetical protein DPMN_158727 [Dreissena polymorpha]|uniref:Uncharacterized protein n=1 Tax=Dreissena polymorpha TaxID=45954 RepID=A0A9D4EN03_DREPO|nr:hypothetical protein DPMN_158727 [Dreissena polymorpha]
MESLLKKANSETREFQEPPFRCFTSTQYIKPNIEKVDCLAEAAFNLLFLEKRENSLVFSSAELKKYIVYKHEQFGFALKSGILSATRKESTLRSSSSFTFIHKSMQEFLAAYHIARNFHLIHDVIFGYLTLHKDAYLDISQVFIFLCGLDISTANMLSVKMNECDVASGFHPKYETVFQKTILSGYREAVANKQTDIRLKLSHFYVNESNAADCHSIWKHNTSTVLSLDIDREEFIGEQLGMPASRYEFDLSSCHKLKSLELSGEWIGLKDSASAVSSDLPAWIVLHCADPTHCRDPQPVLSSIRKIVLRSLKWSSTWLRSLFYTLLTLRQEVECVLEQCKIASCVEGAVGGLYTYTYATIITGLNHTYKMLDYRISGPGLWEALYGLNIKYLSLKVRMEDLNTKQDLPLLKTIQSIKQLEQLCIDADNESPELMETMFSFNSKCVTLSRNGGRNGLVFSHVSVRCYALLVSRQMDHIYIDVNADPDLFERLYGLKIKSLALFGNAERLEASHASLLSNALSSLEQLEVIRIIVQNDSQDLWETLFGLKIKILNIGTEQNGLEVKYVSSLLTSLSSLKQLDTIMIIVKNNIPGLFEALHDLKIKSLIWEEEHLPNSQFPQKLSFEFEYYSTGLVEAPYILNVKSLSLVLWRRFDDLGVNQKSLLSQFLSAPKQLETLCMEVLDSTALWEALHGLAIKSLSLSGVSSRLKLNNISSLSWALSSLTQLETLNMEIFCLKVGHLEAIRGLNIKSLSLNVLNFELNEIASLSQLLLSLTHLESLSITSSKEGPFPELSDALHDLNIKSLRLSKE